MDKNIIELTEEGKAELEEELRFRIDVERDRIIKTLENARAMGDLSENADYSAAREEQGKNEARIKELENIINNSKIIASAASKKGTVKISSVVKYEEVETKEVLTVKIVSTVEVDINEEAPFLKISNVSPLGEALIGRKVGDVVTVKANKTYDIKIKEVK